MRISSSVPLRGNLTQLIKLMQTGLDLVPDFVDEAVDNKATLEIVNKAETVAPVAVEPPPVVEQNKADAPKPNEAKPSLARVVFQNKAKEIAPELTSTEPEVVGARDHKPPIV